MTNVVPSMQPSETPSNVVPMRAGAGAPTLAQRPLLVRLMRDGVLTLPARDREARLAAAGLTLFGLAHAQAVEPDGSLVRLDPPGMLRQDGRDWRISLVPLRPGPVDAGLAANRA